MNPIFTIGLFPEIDKKLIELLRSLSNKDWDKQTLAPQWCVKDVAVHLLDGNIRTLSMLRDQYFGVKPEDINNYQDLVSYLNKLNADWVIAMKRVSPSVLIDLLETTGKAYIQYLSTLDPFGDAIFSVAWAGEQNSTNWFHIAREYTEKWHHQQQIRFAVGQEDVLYEKEYYYPYLETSMRALPHHYQNIIGENNATIKFSIDTYDWYLQSNGNHWKLKTDVSIEPICEVTIDSRIAWRIFTKGISKNEALKKIIIKGNQSLGIHIVDMLAIMA